MAKRKPKTNNERLAEILKEWDLHRRDIGRLLHKKILTSGVCPAVDKWLKDPKQDNFRPMSDADFRLLTLELELMSTGSPLARNDLEIEGTPDRFAILEKARAARTYV